MRVSVKRDTVHRSGGSPQAVGNCFWAGGGGATSGNRVGTGEGGGARSARVAMRVSAREVPHLS